MGFIISVWLVINFSFQHNLGFYYIIINNENLVFSRFKVFFLLVIEITNHFLFSLLNISTNSSVKPSKALCCSLTFLIFFVRTDAEIHFQDSLMVRQVLTDTYSTMSKLNACFVGGWYIQFCFHLILKNFYSKFKFLLDSNSFSFKLISDI